MKMMNFLLSWSYFSDYTTDILHKFGSKCGFTVLCYVHNYIESSQLRRQDATTMKC